MIGPSPDPRQVLLPAGIADEPVAWAISVGVGLGLALLGVRARGWPEAARGALLCLGLTLALTAPALGWIDAVALGSFPTTDKEGSLLFYLDGVHRRLLFEPLGAAADPAARLIGVHTGHLWVTEAFDLLLSPLGAMNAQGLLNAALGWGCMALLARSLGASAGLALALGLPFGLGLHVMRDLNFYTIEKSAVFWLPLFSWAGLRAWRRGERWRWLPALIYGVMSWMNLYLGLVGAALGALAMLAEGGASLRARSLRPETRRLAVACGACAVPGVALALWQHQVMSGGPALATPEQFLWQRAALDSLTLNPPRWNRLELGRALNPVALTLAGLGLWRGRRTGLGRFFCLAGLTLAALSLGPVLWWRGPDPRAGIPNPIYLAAWHTVPGFWRVAKPEVFFEGTWMLALAGGAWGARDRPLWRWEGVVWPALVVAAWLALVRSHPAYPPFAAAQQGALDAGWTERVFSAEQGD